MTISSPYKLQGIYLEQRPYVSQTSWFLYPQTGGREIVVRRLRRPIIGGEMSRLVGETHYKWSVSPGPWKDVFGGWDSNHLPAISIVYLVAGQRSIFELGNRCPTGVQ